MLDLSKVWPEWRATDKVGEGSYGKVYRCVRNEYGIDSVCAIKVISIPQDDDGGETMRFEGMSEAASWAYLNEIVTDFANEIKVMEMLKSAPNIVSVENYKIIKRTERLGWDIYIRMEFLTGFPDYASSHKMTEPDVLQLGRDICNALSVCSKKGIIHRDIKPDNIFVDEFGNYKLGDFGVARKLEKTMDNMSRKGTYSYMAPEVYREEHYDGRADIYSLGTVMYKLLNNNRDPFINANQAVVTVSERSAALARRRKGEPLPPPAYASEETARIVLKACEFNPDNRYNNVEELRADILSVMEGGQAKFSRAGSSAAEKGRILIQQNNGFETKIYPDIGNGSQNKKPAVFRPMDKECELPPPKYNRGARPDFRPQPAVQPIQPPAQPRPVSPPAQRPVAPPSQRPAPQRPVAAPPPQRPAQASVQNHVPMVNVPPASHKKPEKEGMSAAKVAKIIAVLFVIGAVIIAVAFVLPKAIQSMKDSEAGVDKTVDYTKRVDEGDEYTIEKYNGDDICFEEERYDKEDELLGYIEYMFDSDGNEIGYKEYDESGKLVDTIIYEEITEE